MRRVEYLVGSNSRSAREFFGRSGGDGRAFEIDDGEVALSLASLSTLSNLCENHLPCCLLFQLLLELGHPLDQAVIAPI